ncbi:MAG TPA: glycosyltransferase family 2 protein [Humisphaera sp.]|nr:glycosyltransferase family 2 protein [Humisphaera sp.]
MTFAFLLFWLSVACVAYGYLIYPLVLYGAGCLFGKLRNPGYLEDARLPRITLLVAAHNEAAVIDERIKNALALDYPSAKLDIIVASDGSTDQTPAIVRRYAMQGVRLLDYPERRGKASVLNSAIAEARGEIILLSDANVRTDPMAARSLARWFDDVQVGAVCGRLILTDPKSGRNADGLYWKYETFLKKQEGRLGALLGSNGAIYAMRKEHFQPIPPGTIIDDFVIPLAARLRTGRHIIYDRDAIAYEETAPDIRAEFRRRTRIGTGGWQAIAMLWPLLNPRQGWIAFTFFSHKILRWACPFFLTMALLGNLLLCAIPLYRWLFVAQAALYLSALIGGVVPRAFPGARILRLANMFVHMNAALLVGFAHWISRRQTGIWPVTERPAPAGAGASPTTVDPEHRAASNAATFNPI